MHAHRNPNGKLHRNVHPQIEHNADKTTARMADIELIRMLTVKNNSHENLRALRGKLFNIILSKFFIEADV